MDEGETPPLEDIADALNELPNVAGGMWKAKREAWGETYQLGLPMFARGNSWIRFFPRGVNAMSQRLVGPRGLTLQMVLIWRYSESPGGDGKMTTQVPNEQIQGEVAAQHRIPMDVLREATESVINTCEVQMDLPLQASSNPQDPRDADVEYGSSIALTSPTGAWNLAVMGNRESCYRLTRILFAMEEDETPAMEDMADAVSELVNVAAGVMKSMRAEAGEKVQIGLPLFMEGRSCIEFFASGIHGMSQSLTGADGLEFHVILIWQEGKA
jgi:hypothetical protein